MIAVSTIKGRVIIAFVCFFLVNTMGISLFAYYNAIENLEEEQKEHVQDCQRIFTSILAADADGLAKAHIGLTRLEPLLRTFAERDKEQLLLLRQKILLPKNALRNRGS